MDISHEAGQVGSYQICSDHFKESEYKIEKGLKRKLKPDAIP